MSECDRCMVYTAVSGERIVSSALNLGSAGLIPLYYLSKKHEVGEGDLLFRGNQGI